ncbi:unnamed protein product [Rotaria sordida]|uniref:ADP ribosyltransferase domain-containing protein n=1 Tax=Rotaria sordida TaxID=392033 RepID=A0A815HHJ6_9BILA|nr:unnamed protein product [Rotaria sordida]
MNKLALLQSKCHQQVHNKKKNSHYIGFYSFCCVSLVKMATGGLPFDEFHINTADRRLEIFTLVWLDANVNGQDLRETEQKLRSIINHIKKFQDVEKCQKYIEQQSPKERLIIIVSGRFGRVIVPSIHGFRQVISIYVYCMDRKGNKEWADKFAKVKGVVVDFVELVSRIKEDHKYEKKFEEPFSINIFTTGSGKGKSTSGVNGRFVFFQVLIDCLLKLKSKESDKNEVIRCCKLQYEGNDFELTNLHEFEKNYSPDKVLWWYSRESFFYNTLNAILRNENIYMICLFRTFISDIYRQLKYYQVKNHVRVYRGQNISSDELETLKQLVGHFISVNSFFSTSTVYKLALSFVKGPDIQTDLERVLFEIDADPKIVTTKPFADISKCSEYSQESEILFMLGSIFRLDSVERSSDDRLWIIRMTLCSENEHALKDVLIHMRRQLGDGETNLRTLGKVLWTMGKLGLAEHYFIRFLEEVPSHDPLLPTVYDELGELTSQSREYEKSVHWHQKAIEFKNQHPNIDTNKNNKQNDHTSPSKRSGELQQAPLKPTGDYNDKTLYHNNMEPSMKNAGEHKTSMIYHKQTYEVKKKSSSSKHPNSTTTTYSKIDQVHNNMDEPSSGIEFVSKGLKVIEKDLSPNDPDLAKFYGDIGEVFNNIKDYPKALEYYKADLKYKEKSLPANHLDVATCYSTIGSVYRDMGDYSNALSFLEKALAIQQKSLPPTHAHIKQSIDNINDVKKKL